MNINKLVAALFLAVAAIVIIFFVLPKDEDPVPANSNTTSENSTDDSTAEAPEAAPATYTAAEVATHNSEDDCWTIISGGVYDLTSFIPSHEGEDEILRACGIDATTLFTQRETEDGEEVGTGTPHSSAAMTQLAQLKIGELED